MKSELLDIVEKTLKEVVFYADLFDTEAFYVEFAKASGTKYFTKLDSEDFKSFIVMKVEEASDGNIILNKSQLNNILDYIRYNLTYYDDENSPPKTDVYIRTVGDLEVGIEYDLKNGSQQSVTIDKNGWKLSSRKKHKFLTSSLSRAQVTPKKTDKSILDMMKPFVNLTGDDYKLLIIWLIQAFCSGNHSALLISAERGSGKSTLSKIIRRILEPAQADVIRLHDKLEDLLTTLSNMYLCCFDNVRDISTAQSDILCSAITCGTATKRSLFTTNNLTVQNLHNTIVINGITVFPKESDLAERFLVINLKKLSCKKLKREKDFWADFETQLPFILGAIFDTLSQAMTCITSISYNDLHRMADSFVDMLAIALALGITEAEFRQIYEKNIEKMNKLRTETPIVKAIKELMDNNPQSRYVEGSSEEIYLKIMKSYTGDKNDLPGSASQFSRHAEAEHDNIFAAGFRFNVDDTSSKNSIIKIIRKK